MTVLTTKRCNGCKVEKDISEFAINRNSGRVYYLCRPCSAVKSRGMYIKHKAKKDATLAAYKASQRGRQVAHLASMRANKRYPDKQIARSRLRYAVKVGKISKSACEECGNPRVDAHHYLGYEPEHWYDVKWLCREHHRDAHKFSLRSRGYAV